MFCDSKASPLLTSISLIHSVVSALPPLTFESLPTDLAEVGPPFLVPAGNVPQQGSSLGELLVTKLAAEGTLACVGPVVLVQAC